MKFVLSLLASAAIFSAAGFCAPEILPNPLWKVSRCSSRFRSKRRHDAGADGTDIELKIDTLGNLSMVHATEGNVVVIEVDRKILGVERRW